MQRPVKIQIDFELKDSETRPKLIVLLLAYPLLKNVPNVTDIVV